MPHLNFYSPWYAVEHKIQEELEWLTNSIDTFSNEENFDQKICNEIFTRYLLRNIALLILSQKVQATEITKEPSLKSFWKVNCKINNKKRNKKTIFHGKEWHAKTMKMIENHFLSLGYKVIREPNLYLGRADLEAYKQREKPLFIEVGTISLFKLWTNLRLMKNCIYLIVPNDDRLIEFVCKQTNSKIFIKNSTAEER